MVSVRESRVSTPADVLMERTQEGNKKAMPLYSFLQETYSGLEVSENI